MVKSKVDTKAKNWLQPQYHNLEECNQCSTKEQKGQYSESIEQNSKELTKNPKLKSLKGKHNKATKNDTNSLKDKNEIITSRQHSKKGQKTLKNNISAVPRDYILLENKGTVVTKVSETSLKKKTRLPIDNNKLDDKNKSIISELSQERTKHNKDNNKKMIKLNYDVEENKIFNEFILVLKENQQFINTEQHNTKKRFLTIMKDYIDTKNGLPLVGTSQETRKEKNLSKHKKIVDFNSTIDIREFRGSSPVSHTKIKELHKKQKFENRQNTK